MRAQTRHDISDGGIQLISGRNDPVIADVLLRGGAGEELSPLEQFQYRGYLNTWLRYWEDVHYQYRNGLYDEGEFDKQREATRDFLNRSAGWPEYWCERRTYYSTEFAQMIDELIVTSLC